jgi:hypothetical protein
MKRMTTTPSYGLLLQRRWWLHTLSSPFSSTLLLQRRQPWRHDCHLFMVFYCEKDDKPTLLSSSYGLLLFCRHNKTTINNRITCSHCGVVLQ